jgi:hypothetical protein
LKRGANRARPPSKNWPQRWASWWSSCCELCGMRQVRFFECAKFSWSPQVVRESKTIGI